MWRIAFAEDDNGISLGKNRIDSFRKRRPEEFRLLLSRAQSIVSALNADYPISAALARGWVHLEKGGAFAIDPGRKVARMYCVINQPARQLLILTIGDKSTQSRDVQDCKRWASEINRRD